MKAITLYQPWASLMAWGIKRIETRGWSTSYTGWLAIHAAAPSTNHNRELAAAFEDPWIRFQLDVIGVTPGNWTATADGHLPMRRIVGVTRLLDCVPVERSGVVPDTVEYALGNYGPGRYAWRTKGMLRLDSGVLAMGRQGLWTPPPDVAAAMERQLGQQHLQAGGTMLPPGGLR